MEVQVSKYNEENPVVSFRIPKMVQFKFDIMLANHMKSRQEYLSDLLMNDLKERGLLKIAYSFEDE